VRGLSIHLLDHLAVAVKVATQIVSAVLPSTSARAFLAIGARILIPPPFVVNRFLVTLFLDTRVLSYKTLEARIYHCCYRPLQDPIVRIPDNRIAKSQA
jgi:hypothetical protein